MVPDRAVVTETEKGALEIVSADVAERLRPVCSDWPEDRFQQLVRDVALSTLRYGIARATFEMLRRRQLRGGSQHVTPDTPFPPGAPPADRGRL